MVGANTVTYTVGSIMNRLYIQYLTPPDDQEAQVNLLASISDTDTDVTLGAFALPEDEALLRQGSILEADQELLRVTAYNAATPSVTVTRSEYGTVAAAHTSPLLMTLNPAYTRAAAFEAVADNILLLYPKLFTVTQEFLISVGDHVYPLDDALAVEILSIWGDDWESSRDRDGDLVDFHPLAGGRAIIADAREQDLWVRYRKRLARPTSEDDTLTALGMSERWVNIVMAGAAADLLVGRDIPAVQTEWIKSVLEAENIRVGSRMSIAGGLRQYRNMLMDDTSAELKSEYRTKIRIRSAMRQVQ
jgi:hypothetical protein